MQNKDNLAQQVNNSDALGLQNNKKEIAINLK